jgi:hypothetical protein
MRSRGGAGLAGVSDVQRFNRRRARASLTGLRQAGYYVPVEIVLTLAV